MKKTFKHYRDYGFFDQDIQLSKLSKLGDPLEKLNRSVDLEMFRSLLEEKLATQAKGLKRQKIQPQKCRGRYLVFRGTLNLHPVCTKIK